MNPSSCDPLFRVEFEAQDAFAKHPPRWKHPNKKAVAAMSCPPGCVHSGTVSVTRWAQRPLPKGPDDRDMKVVGRADVFDYAPVLPGAVEWHLNFADVDLFARYGGPLFAQDEMQAVEHPGLAATRETLLAGGFSTLVTESGWPTPFLVRGVERRCRVNTAPDTAAGRRWGLYGRNFAAASADDVRSAVTVLEPPTVSNIIAAEAPACGRGAYSPENIRFVLVAAHTAFRAAVAESVPAPAVVHTGFWGCGVYGGNRELMAMLQLAAARMAGAALLVFHSFDVAGLETFERAAERADTLPDDTGALVDSVLGMGFRWGASDGN